MSLLSGDGNAGNGSGFCIKYRRHRICTGMYGAGNTTKIRKVDVCTRYSSMQYLIILFEPDEKQFQISWNVFSVNIVSSAERKTAS